ncbi:hypothetical protein D3C81_1831110 [compost metagenome]
MGGPQEDLFIQVPIFLHSCCFVIVRFSKNCRNAIIKNARQPKSIVSQGENSTPLETMIQPPTVVPNVTPRFPKEVARLLANSNASGADEII